MQGALERFLTGHRRPYMSADQAPTLLLVEDDPGHARLIERNLRRAYFPYAIVILRDRPAVLDYVFPVQEARSVGPLPPYLVLLDLHLPGWSGMEVLARLKSDPRTRYIPVTVLTTTDDPHAIEPCYALGCNAYLSKPVVYDQFVAVIIEDHYSARRGQPTPMDMEWAKDGQPGALFIVQARPEMVHAQKAYDTLEFYHLTTPGPVLARGRSVGEKISHGPVRVIKDVH